MDSYQVLFPLFGLIAPFLIWPIEKVLPYPHVIEEIFKAGAVWYLISQVISNRQKVYLTILFALLFAFSESIFYYINFVGVNLTLLLPRLLLTAVLHTTTSLVILGSALVNKKLIVGGFILAVLVHYFYNLKIDSLFALFV